MDFAKRYIVTPGKAARLSHRDPGDTGGFKNKRAAKERLGDRLEDLTDLQYLLYAEGHRALLIVLQAMDAGGKDGTIRHVMGPLNPQGCCVTSFKAPTSEELAHDFLWRIHKAVPGRGQIGIFNRSHYEDVLVVRVHDLVPKRIWSKRYAQINDFEKMLAANDVHILKFFLHVSPEEQLQRLKARLDDPKKHWKANPRDFDERKRWKDYTAAFEDALTQCSKPWAPWYAIPADNKWFRNLAIAEIIRNKLKSLDMKLPKADFDVSEFNVE